MEDRPVKALRWLVPWAMLAAWVTGAEPADSPPVYRTRTVAQWIALLRSGDWDDKQEAVHALGEAGPAAAEAVPALIALLGQKDLGADAATALGKIGPAAKEAVKALTDATGSSDRRLRLEAAAALARIDPTRAPASVKLLLAEMRNLDAA
jgi:HEAT repeat protein